jgi:hypothetical protein
MSTSAIGGFSNLASILISALQSAGLSSSPTGNVGTQQSDNTSISPLGQILSTLQQLQESDPTKYKQVTAQIATNLQNAAQTAKSDGLTGAATELNQLSSDFANASSSGQLPNIQDLSQAVDQSGGGRHHHHHSASSSAGSETSSSSTSTSTNQTQQDSLNPLNIIANTLSSVSGSS